MELALAAALWLLTSLWLLARRLGVPDYPALREAELIGLHEAQEKRLAASTRTSSGRYQAALERAGRLTAEMKRRGLIDAAAWVHDPLTLQTLELQARQKYSRSLSEVQALSARGDPAALYQLGELFRLAREDDVALGFIARAAEAGDAQAQFAWALALLGAQDEPGPQRQRDALTWLRMAALQGHGQARLALTGLMKSLPAAIVWPALREARRRLKQSGPRALPSASPGAATAAVSRDPAPTGAGQRSFG